MGLQSRSKSSFWTPKGDANIAALQEPEGEFLISTSSPGPPSSSPCFKINKPRKVWNSESVLNCTVCLLFPLLLSEIIWVRSDGESQEDSVELIYWWRNLVGSPHCCMMTCFTLPHYIWILEKRKFNCSSVLTQKWPCSPVFQQLPKRKQVVLDLAGAVQPMRCYIPAHVALLFYHHFSCWP